jgi:hypothetical protein
MIARRALGMTLLAALVALPASARDCEQGSDTGSSRGCVLELGRFPQLLSGLDRRDAGLSAVLDGLGEPLSTRTTRERDPREPEYEFDAVVLSYPAFTLELHCRERCSLTRFELRQSDRELACGLRIGMPLADLLAHPDVATQIYSSTPSSSPRRAEIAWERNWREGEFCVVSHAWIRIEAAADGRIERISWEYGFD